MKFSDFEIHAYPVIRDASCRSCGRDLVEVSNGWFSSALYCDACEFVYEIKMVRIAKDKIPPEFIEQCKKSIEKQKS